jgi:hypothetical protein
LNCYSNQLIALDVSAHTALTDLRIQYNQFTATALNALFNTLNSNPGTKTIYIRNNPRSGTNANKGTSDCDPSIAITKGWTVNTAD